MINKYDFPVLPIGSDEGLVALFHDILPSLMIRADFAHPGISSSAFSILEEDGLYTLFKDCCESLGYEIRYDHHSDKSFLAKMPESIFVAYRIDKAVQAFAQHNQMEEIDMYKVMDSGKTQFNVIANGIVGRSGVLISTGDESLASWRFSDGSVLNINDKSVLSMETAGFAEPDNSIDSFDRKFLDCLRSAVGTEAGLHSAVNA